MAVLSTLDRCAELLRNCGISFEKCSLKQVWQLFSTNLPNLWFSAHFPCLHSSNLRQPFKSHHCKFNNLPQYCTSQATYLGRLFRLIKTLGQLVAVWLCYLRLTNVQSCSTTWILKKSKKKEQSSTLLFIKIKKC